MPTDWSSTMWTTGWRATDGDPRSRAGEDPEPASYLKGASQPKQVRPAYAGVETSLAIFTASATVTAGPLRFSYTPYVPKSTVSSAPLRGLGAGRPPWLKPNARIPMPATFGSVLVSSGSC